MYNIALELAKFDIIFQFLRHFKAKQNHTCLIVSTQYYYDIFPFIVCVYKHSASL